MPWPKGLPPFKLLEMGGVLDGGRVACDATRGITRGISSHRVSHFIFLIFRNDENLMVSLIA